ncbi:MAG TPA: class I SAM-dependent methyltransferase [Xanthobacteraceae bacterium]|nr:class I SAM-dependent methyltransferase [Xanthobacteraceae bacterium]
MTALRLFSAAIIPVTIVASMSGYGIENRYNVFIPYVPTPEFIVDRMLEMAEIGKDDLLLDLGSGDGRIVIAAAQRYGARGRGVEIDPKLVEESKENARKVGVDHLAEFVAQDMFVAKMADASVLSLYVLTASNLELRPRILSEMKPGSRVVSHQFSMGAWIADKQESYGDIQIYMWYVPARVAGTWRLDDGKRTYMLTIEQSYQDIGGTMKIGDRTLPLRLTKLRGAEIDFAVDLGEERPIVYRGRVSDGIMEPRPSPGAVPGWRAVRITAPVQEIK